MINKALVIVNESIITQADLDQQISIARLEFSASGRAPPPDSVLSSQVLEEMIVDNLLLDVAQEMLLGHLLSMAAGGDDTLEFLERRREASNELRLRLRLRYTNRSHVTVRPMHSGVGIYLRLCLRSARRRGHT